MWVQLAIAVVSLAVSILLYRPPEGPARPGIDDITVPQATQGKEFPFICGTVWIEDPLEADWGDHKTKAIKSKGGKK